MGKGRFDALATIVIASVMVTFAFDIVRRAIEEIVLLHAPNATSVEVRSSISSSRRCTLEVVCGRSFTAPFGLLASKHVLTYSSLWFMVYGVTAPQGEEGLDTLSTALMISTVGLKLGLFVMCYLIAKNSSLFGLLFFGFWCL